MRNLRSAVAAGVLQVTAQHTALTLAAARLIEALEHSTDVRVAFAIVARRREFDGGAAAQKSFDLLDRAKLCFVHVDHHLQDDQPVSSSSYIFFQAHVSVETRGPFRLIPPWASSAEA